MNFLDAAHAVLADASGPLHFEEITKRAFEAGLLTSNGATPSVTMGSRLYTASKDDDARFVREGKGVFGLSSKKPRGIDFQIEQINKQTRELLKERLHALEPKEFEALVLDLLVEMGFDENSMRVTPFRGDGGIDVVGTYRAAGLTQVKAAVQVKRWKNNVQSPEVQKVRGALDASQQGIIITTSGYSKGARDEAVRQGATPIGLIDGSELVELLFKHRVGVIGKNYVIFQLDEERWGAIEKELSRVAPAHESNKARAQAEKQDGDASRTTQGKRLVAIRVLGKELEATKWRDGLGLIFQELYDSAPSAFRDKCIGLHGRKRQYFSFSPDDLFEARQLGDTGIFYEVNMSSVECKKVSVLLALALGLSPDAVEWLEDERVERTG